MDKGCWDCVYKHLAAASVAADERYTGYSSRGAMKEIGNLVHAESEAVAVNREFALLLRQHRLEVMPNKLGHSVPYEALCGYAETAGAVGTPADYAIPEECFAGLPDYIIADWPDNASTDTR